MKFESFEETLLGKLSGSWHARKRSNSARITCDSWDLKKNERLTSVFTHAEAYAQYAGNVDAAQADAGKHVTVALHEFRKAQLANS